MIVQRVVDAAAGVDCEVVLCDGVLVARALNPRVNDTEPGDAVRAPLCPLLRRGATALPMKLQARVFRSVHGVPLLIVEVQLGGAAGSRGEISESLKKCW